MAGIVTLADKTKNLDNFGGNKAKQAINKMLMESLYRNTDFPFKNMHSETNAALVQSIPFTSAKLLPKASWTSINQEIAATKGSTARKARHMAHLRAVMEIDNAILDDPNKLWDDWVQQGDQHMIAFAYETASAIWNANPIDDPDAPVGIPYMAANASRYQLDARVYQRLGSSGDYLYAGSSGIDLTPAGGSAAGIAAATAINMAFNILGSKDGDGLSIHAPFKALEFLTARIKQGGNGTGFRSDKDAFDRSVPKYREAILESTGWVRNETDGNDDAEAISLTQNLDGTAETGGLYTTMVIVDNRPGRLNLVQKRPLGVESRPDGNFSKKKVIDWGLVVVDGNTRPFVVIRGWKVGS